MSHKQTKVTKQKAVECFYCGLDAVNGGKVWHDSEHEWKDCCVQCAWRLYDEVDGNVEIVE